MASAEDIRYARSVIRDSLVALRWASSDDGEDDQGEPVVNPVLKPALSDAVEEVHDGPFVQALRILDGENPDWPDDRVSAVLDSVGWSGASRAFKEQALAEAGHQDVMAAVEGAGPKPRRGVWRRVLRVLNAALGSLSAIPGVEPVKELKDFAEGATSE